MRIAKCILLTTGLVLGLMGCGKKEGPDATAQMKKNKMVRIATDAVNLPFEFGAGTGVQGFDVDIGTEIGKDLGYEVKWIKFPFERTFDLLKNGEVEMIISAVAIERSREADFAFSEPYFASGDVIARRLDKPEIKDLASLSGRKVGVQSSRSGDRFMKSQKTATNVNIVKFATLDDALGALNRTEVDAVIGDESILTYSIYKSFPNLMTLGQPLTKERYAIVVRRSERELLAKVNGTLQRLRQGGELEALQKKWFQNVMEEAGKQRDQLAKEQALKESPKDITFNLVKLSGDFRMDRLDGYQVNLIGTQSHQSTPIETEGQRGSCKLSGVVPGEYRLNMPIFKLNTTIQVPKAAAKNITFEMSIRAGGIDIAQKQ